MNIQNAKLCARCIMWNIYLAIWNSASSSHRVPESSSTSEADFRSTKNVFTAYYRFICDQSVSKLIFCISLVETRGHQIDLKYGLNVLEKRKIRIQRKLSFFVVTKFTTKASFLMMLEKYNLQYSIPRIYLKGRKIFLFKNLAWIVFV